VGLSYDVPSHIVWGKNPATFRPLLPYHVLDPLYGLEGNNYPLPGPQDLTGMMPELPTMGGGAAAAVATGEGAGEGTVGAAAAEVKVAVAYP
jgi:hypothetical protein